MWDKTGLCRIEPTTGLIRWYEDPEAVFCAPHRAIATIVWRSPTVAEILGHTVRGSPHNQASLRALLLRLDQAGIEQVVSTRSEGRLLPGSVRQPDGSMLTDIQRLMRRHGGSHADQ